MSDPARPSPAGGPAGEATPCPTLHHVNLKTTRLREMIDWYGVVVGMRPVAVFDDIAFLSNDGANHRFALIAVPGLVDDPEKTRRTGMHHAAFEYPSVGDLLATYERLRGRGIVPHLTLDHGMTMSFYYLDPDGNSIELQVDNFGDWSRSTAFMTEPGGAFAANPIGVFVDPEQMLVAWHAGADARELHERAYRGEFPAAPETMDLRFPAPG